MSNLYFLMPNTKLARTVVEDLRKLGLSDDNLGLIARDDLVLGENLPQADLSDTTDFKPSLKRGLAAGGTAGLLAGLAINVVPGGFALGGMALAGATLAGGAFGAWVSSLIGVSMPNSEIEAFRAAVEQGQLLMIVDAAGEQHDKIRERVVAHYPNVVIRGA